MLLTGAQIIIEILKEEGVDTVFGYPGSSVLGIYDELYKNRDSIRHILTSHEQGAAHAADGYARASGKTGVCIATSGPGATNLVTGIATAYMDSSPVLAITCNVDKESLGKDSFQEVDIAGITMPVTKHGYIIKDIKKLASTMRRAFAITREGRPGPVIIDITKNVVDESTEFEPAVPEIRNKMFFLPEKTVTMLEKAKEVIEKAKRPLILVGGGVVKVGAGYAVEELAQKLDAPVICSLMGKGAIDETNPRFVGMLGTSGSSAAGELLAECDTLISLGSRFSDRMIVSYPNFAAQAKIIDFDIDPAEVNKNIVSDFSVIGDLAETAIALCRMVEENTHASWNKTARRLKKEEAAALPADNKDFTGEAVINTVWKLTKGEAYITTEVGKHQLTAAMGYKTAKEGRFFTSGGLGTMGFGLSAAIGVKLACPDKTVINFAGDGCFRMNMNELLTASRHKIPVIQVVFDNQILGLVYHWQEVLYEGRYSATEFMDKLDFVKLSEALGVKAVRVTNVKELESAVKKAISSKEAMVIDCQLAAAKKA